MQQQYDQEYTKTQAAEQCFDPNHITTKPTLADCPANKHINKLDLIVCFKCKCEKIHHSQISAKGLLLPKQLESVNKESVLALLLP